MAEMFSLALDKFSLAPAYPFIQVFLCLSLHFFRDPSKR
jgi:hypothetical protein